MLVEIFRAGIYKFGGKTYNFGLRFCKKLVRSYNRQAFKNGIKAPFVKGHPTTDEPAHGWVETLKMNGSTLLADIQNLSVEVMEDIKAGRYRNISASLQGNRLKHVGLLGGASPRVKGMLPVTFDDKDSGEPVITFNNDGEQIAELEKENARLIKELLEFQVAEFATLQKAKIVEFKVGSEVAKRITDQTKALYAITGKEKAENVLVTMCELAGKSSAVLIGDMDYQERDSGTDDRDKLHKDILAFCEKNKCGYETGAAKVIELREKAK